METCFCCKGDMTESRTTHFTDLGGCMVIVKNVPFFKCDQCGEIAYTGSVLRELEQIISAAKSMMTEIAVVSYPDKAA